MMGAAGLLALAVVAPAGAQTGNAMLAGRARLGVRGCGADRDPNFSTTVTMVGDRTWTARDTEGDLFGGTWAPHGTSGRAFDLSFDAATEADLIATIIEDVGVLCDTPGAVTVTSARRQRFLLKLNRPLSKAKLALLYVFEGHAGNRSGSARYRIRAKGPFVPAT